MPIAEPGDLEIDTSAVAPVEPVAPAAEPAIEAAAEPVVEAVAEPDKPAKKGLLEEMIEHRTVRKELERKFGELSPVLSRLTPELQQAVMDGRVVVRPMATTSDARREQLTKTAERLRLVDADGKPDLDAAERVDAEIRSVVRAEVAPLHQHDAMTAARENIAKAVAFATEHGYDVETVKSEYERALAAPNGATLVADPGVAEQLWYGAIGKATAAGKMPSKPAAARQAAPGAVIAEPGGRRSPGASVTLTPALAAVYKSNGMDPAKSFTSTHKGPTDLSESVTLE